MNFKELIEKRNALVDKMNEMFKTCETEKRAFNADETASCNKIVEEIKAIDETIRMAEAARSYEKTEVTGEPAKDQDKFEAESRAFGEFLRSNEFQKRDGVDVNFTKGDNGAVIPATIANKIIETVENICPIYQMATKFHVKGTLSFPKYDKTTNVTCAYASEFTPLLSTSGKFTSIPLGGFLAGALTKISNSLINNAQFDIVSYAITKIAEAIAKFLEGEMLNGTVAAGKMQGAAETGVAVASAGVKAVSVDDLIDIQRKVPQVFQANACWIMHPDTLTALYKMKDGNDRLLLQDDIRMGFGSMLFGKHVYESDAMAKASDGGKAIVYGDMSGMYVNIHEEVEVQVLREKYADEHVTGVIAWLEMDSKLVEAQKVAVLNVKKS